MKPHGKRTVLDYARVIEAGVFLIVAAVFLRVLPFRVVAARIGRVGPANSAGPVGMPSDVHAHILVGVDRAARRLPGSHSCLHRAMAGSWMLNRRGIAASMCFGVARRPHLKAHAWLVSGGRVVLGSDAMVDFTPIASITTQPTRTA